MANYNVSDYVASYSSFSGVDIKAVFADKTIGELQAISVSITREKAPIYTMGSADPRGISRGKRGIAGTLIFVMFNRNALLEELRDLMFLSDKDDIHPAYTGSDNGALAGQFTLASESGRTAGTTLSGSTMDSAATGQGQESSVNAYVYDDQALAHPWYADQIPPYDITLAAANEYGALAAMKIFGVETLNEGFGVSIDDIVIEQQYTYICRSVLQWQWIKTPTNLRVHA
jgi:hypothetical protein